MRPFQASSPWNVRPQDRMKLISPYSFVYFLCEGKNTEFHYFNGLRINKKQLGIKSNIELCVLEKTDEDEGLTDPIKLFEKSVLKIDELKKTEFFSELDDKFVIIFDTDTFCSQSDLDDFFTTYANENIIFGVTYPSFEIFLYSHDTDKLTNLIANHTEEVVENIKVGNQRPLLKHFTIDFGFNPKKLTNKEKVEALALEVKIAITNASLLVSRSEEMHRKLSSNIATILAEILFPE